MDNNLKAIIVVIIFAIGVFVGAIAHEADMANNFEEYGNAKAWFWDIKQDCK